MNKNSIHLIFENVRYETDKIENIIGKTEVFLGVLDNIPTLPTFRKEVLHTQIASGIHSILAWENDVISIENIGLILEGNSMPAGRKFQEDEVNKIIGIHKKLFKEIVIENKRPEITLEFIERLYKLLPINPADEGGGISTAEQTEWLNKFCVFLSQITSGKDNNFPRKRQDEKVNGVLKSIVTRACFLGMQPFGKSSAGISYLIEFCLMAKFGVPYHILYSLPSFYMDTKKEHDSQLELIGKSGDITSFLEYALHGMCDGIEEIINAKLFQLLTITWHQHIQTQLLSDEGSGAKVTERRQKLMLAFPLSNNEGFTFEQILILNPAIARVYAKSNKTARRDVSALIELGLLVKRKKKYLPNVVAVMGETASNSSIIKREVIAERKVDYSHHVLPLVSTVEIKSELLKMLDNLKEGV
jgi:hypothetical protein